MGDYPDNSYSGREQRKDSDSTPEKKLEKVVSGGVKTRKKSKVKKFADFFVPEDTDNVKSYILMDVIIPGIKNALADVVSIILFGEIGGVGRRGRDKSKISYQRYWRDDRDDRRDYVRPKNIGGFDYDDILFETRGDADLVLDQLESAIANFGIASVADLYDLAGVTCRSYTADKYGWTDIRTAKVVRLRDGYILQLPRAVQID